MFRKILYQLTTIATFILAAAAMHAALNITMPSTLINISLLIISLFLTLQACSRLDKSLGLGKYSQHDQDDDYDSCQGIPTNTQQQIPTTQEEPDNASDDEEKPDHLTPQEPNAYTDFTQPKQQPQPSPHPTDIPLNDNNNLID